MHLALETNMFSAGDQHIKMREPYTLHLISTVGSEVDVNHAVVQHSVSAPHFRKPLWI